MPAPALPPRTAPPVAVLQPVGRPSTLGLEVLRGQAFWLRLLNDVRSATTSVIASTLAFDNPDLHGLLEASCKPAVS